MEQSRCGTHVRIDPVSGRRVLMAANRAARPHDFGIPVRRAAQGSCPFCPGNENETPHEIVRYGRSGDVPWLLRVVPNKFPAVDVATDPSSETPDGELFRRQSAAGAHEVVIASSRHISCISQLTVEECRLLASAWQDRLRAHGAKPGLVYSQAFMNVGPEAGASIEHLHGQIMGLSFVPLQVHEQLLGAERYHKQTGKCVFCDILSAEQRCAERIVFETEHFVVLCPFASRFAYEMWIVPRQHHAHFTNIPEAARVEMALTIREAVGRLVSASPGVAYNLCLQTAPHRTGPQALFHWHLTILPRLSHVAGFEWSTGVHVNTTLPEEVAAVLRAVC